MEPQGLRKVHPTGYQDTLGPLGPSGKGYKISGRKAPSCILKSVEKSSLGVGLVPQESAVSGK